ncbi:uncharacterized protein LOC110040092 [Orbicella faveolata]|uniref:uncharacterized protein LOC110040092 n=1 Tax=Orbicella faveolata TaxID=48498 RepID=UPI0009E60DE4|nr:uncharacterized protein LOC110040092 [Orbicella faveolata]
MALLYKEVGIRKRRTRCESIVVGGLVAGGIACLVAGIVLMIQANTIKTSEQCEPQKYTRAINSGCGYSAEARSSGLERFFHQAQERFYELLPHKIAFKPGVTSDEIRQRYKSYDSTPTQIKFVTDEIAKLTKRLENMKIRDNKLTLREKRAKAQLSHWMRHVFPYGVPFAYDYYSGDWLMGPNIFCWSSICFLPMDVGKALWHFQPSSVSEMETLRNKLMEINQTFTQFVENMKLGVAAGMVRTVEECKAGLDGLRWAFRDVDINGPVGKEIKIVCCLVRILDATYMKAILVDGFLSKMTSGELDLWKVKHGRSVNESLRQFVIEYVGEPIQRALRLLGILDATYMKAILVDGFLSKMTSGELDLWKVKHGRSVNESLRQFVIEYVGEPIQRALRYIEKEHLQYCAPSELSSGLANLPLDFIYINGTKTNRTTTKTLPTGEKLDGKATYLKLMQYFTTTEKTPDEIYELGWSIINRKYPEVLRRGPSPLNYLKESIRKYMACVKDANSQPDCEDFLQPPKNTASMVPQQNLQQMDHHSFKIF